MGGTRVRRDGVTWWLDDGSADLAAELARLVRDVDAGKLTNQKSGRRKELYFAELCRGEHLLKVNRYPGAAGWWRRLRGSKARREQRIARSLAARGLPVPLPVAWGERGGLRLEACYLLVARLPGVVDLTGFERDRAASHALRRAVATAFGALARRVHDAGLQQDDFAPNNFLVRASPAPELFVIDFERARVRSRPVTRRHRLRALARLDRRLPEVSASERWRFLLAYAADPVEARRLWWELSALAGPVAARDLARLRRTSTRPGRRIRPVRNGRVSGWARRDAPLDALLAAGDAALARAWRRCDPDRSRHRARELWATAHLLWLRGLGAAPLALLRGERGSVLWLARETAARELAALETTPPEDLHALERLLGRLLSLGSLDARLEAREISVIPCGPGRLRAVLLAPERLRIGHAPPPEGRLAEAHRLARRLIGINP